MIMAQKVYYNGNVVNPQTDYNAVKNPNSNGVLAQEVQSIVHSVTEETFTVDINYNRTIASNQLSATTTESEDAVYYAHTCYFRAPSSDAKAKLVIICPGGGMGAVSGYNYCNEGAIFNALGYAVLSITGYSSAWATEHGVTRGAAPIGSWYATEEVIKAYQYVAEKYAWIDKEAVFLTGESQGGQVAENVAEMTNIPFRAIALDAPALSIENHQMRLSSRTAMINALYGMDGTYNADLCIGCDPYTRNVSDSIGTTLANVTAKKYRNTNAPTLIIAGSSDSIVSPNITKCYIRAVMNAGGFLKFRYYSGIGHGVVQYSSVKGKVGMYDCTQGMADILTWFARYGGYSFTITEQE